MLQNTIFLYVYVKSLEALAVIIVLLSLTAMKTISRKPRSWLFGPANPAKVRNFSGSVLNKAVIWKFLTHQTIIFKILKVYFSDS